jgi:putative DNA primase/helicase
VAEVPAPTRAERVQGWDNFVFQALSNFIVELGEVDATLRKADLAQLKAFMTKDQDVLRRPYAKKESSYARRTIFCASVNESAFLKDPTGNRRFWTIACDVINFNHDIDMQQLWAEFAEMYRAGEAWYLEASEMVALNDGNEEFMEIDPVEERILSSYEWESERQLSRNATQICQEIGIHEPKRADANSVCRVLKKMGIVRLPRTKLGIFYKMPRQKTAFEQKS